MVCGRGWGEDGLGVWRRTGLVGWRGGRRRKEREALGVERAKGGVVPSRSVCYDVQQRGVGTRDTREGGGGRREAEEAQVAPGTWLASRRTLGMGQGLPVRRFACPTPTTPPPHTQERRAHAWVTRTGRQRKGEMAWWRWTWKLTPVDLSPHDATPSPGVLRAPAPPPFSPCA